MSILASSDLVEYFCIVGKWELLRSLSVIVLPEGKRPGSAL